MDKIFQTGVKLAEHKKDGQRRSEGAAKTEHVCVTEKNCNYCN